MKRVINGKLYNTETATDIASYSNGLSTRDFGHIRETLYRTDNGNYFVFGRGGPKTKYANHSGNGTSGSKEIIPKTDEEALQWCEKRDIDGETVVDEFSDLVDQA